MSRCTEVHLYASTMLNANKCLGYIRMKLLLLLFLLFSVLILMNVSQFYTGTAIARVLKTPRGTRRSMRVAFEAGRTRLEGAEVLGDLEGSTGLLLDLLEGNALGELSEGKAAAALVLAVNLEDSEVGNDGRNDALAGKREGALLDDLRVAVLDVSASSSTRFLCILGSKFTLSQ